MYSIGPDSPIDDSYNAVAKITSPRWREKNVSAASKMLKKGWTFFLGRVSLQIRMLLPGP